jgi:hypothetical protein
MAAILIADDPAPDEIALPAVLRRGGRPLDSRTSSPDAVEHLHRDYVARLFSASLVRSIGGHELVYCLRGALPLLNGPNRMYSFPVAGTA